MNQAASIFSEVDSREQDSILDAHNAESSVNHALRWGPKAVDEIIGDAPESTETSDLYRQLACVLLRKAQEMDGLQPYLVTHEFDDWSAAYVGWCRGEPTKDGAESILDVEFEEDRGECLMIEDDLTLEDLTGVSESSRMREKSSAASQGAGADGNTLELSDWSGWTGAMRVAALKEGWALCECSGSSFGDVQIQRIDHPEDDDELVRLGVPYLATDKVAVDIVWNGTGDYHRMARQIITKLNPQEFKNCAKREFASCGICGGYHKAGFVGDCRDDAQRFTIEQLNYLFGEDGWIEGGAS